MLGSGLFGFMSGLGLLGLGLLANSFVVLVSKKGPLLHVPGYVMYIAVPTGECCKPKSTGS